MAVKKITAKELYEKMRTGEEVIITDVRDASKFNKFHINDEAAETIHLPKTEIFALHNGEEIDLSMLPADKEIIVTCTTGNSAAKCAAVLQEHNYNAVVLEGGLTAWKQQSIDQMWSRFKAKNPDVPDQFNAWSFGNSAEMADELAELVLAGTKTATASNYALYELKNEPLPYAGLYNVVCGGNGMAAAVIETTAVDVMPFEEVTAEHAYLEGEGDRSLDYWRTVHETFFKEELEKAGLEFDERMLVVCERFRLVSN